jgi:hypothetical protein
MTSIIQLRNKAHSYAVDRLRDGADYQRIEWEFLNDPAFAALVSHPDIEDLYHYISTIIADAELTLDEEWAAEQDPRRYEQSLIEYPDLDTYREF